MALYTLVRNAPASAWPQEGDGTLARLPTALPQARIHVRPPWAVGFRKVEQQRQDRRDLDRPGGERSREGLPVLRPQVAGIDLGSQEHWVCAPSLDAGDREVSIFGGTTPALRRMARWLKQRKVESVAMESTGVYWIPVHEVLEEEGFEVLLCETHGATTAKRRSPRN
jgi:hypothetical protein